MLKVGFVLVITYSIIGKVWLSFVSHHQLDSCVITCIPADSITLTVCSHSKFHNVTNSLNLRNHKILISFSWVSKEYLKKSKLYYALHSISPHTGKLRNTMGHSRWKSWALVCVCFCVSMCMCVCVWYIHVAICVAWVPYWISLGLLRMIS